MQHWGELYTCTSYDLRAQYPNLPAQLVCAARVKATEALKRALDRLKKGHKASAPHHRVCPIRYEARSYWVKWENLTTCLATLQGRGQLSFPLHKGRSRDELQLPLPVQQRLREEAL